MRPKARIKRILKLIEQIWENNQDQRLGQLLVNLGLSSDSARVWSTEDDEWERILESKNGTIR